MRLFHLQTRSELPANCLQELLCWAFRTKLIVCLIALALASPILSCTRTHDGGSSTKDEKNSEEATESEEGDEGEEGDAAAADTKGTPTADASPTTSAASTDNKEPTTKESPHAGADKSPAALPEVTPEAKIEPTPDAASTLPDASNKDATGALAGVIPEQSAASLTSATKTKSSPLQKTLSKHDKAFASCYKQHVKAKSCKWSVTLTWKINKKGKVVNAKVRSSKPPKFSKGQQCMVKKLNAITFSPAKTNTTKLQSNNWTYDCNDKTSKDKNSSKKKNAKNKKTTKPNKDQSKNKGKTKSKNSSKKKHEPVE